MELHDFLEWAEEAATNGSLNPWESRALNEYLSDESQVAHDLWLTRNRHGAGIMDRGLPQDVARLLTEHAHAYGEVDLMPGDQLPLLDEDEDE